MELTIIGKTNKDAFIPLLPPSISERFHNEPGVFAFGAVSDGKAVCAISCEVEEETIHILSLFAADDYRRQGFEKFLLSELTERARKSKISSINAFFIPQSNYDIRNIYEASGFLTEERKESFYTLSLAKIKQLKSLKGDSPKEAVFLKDLPQPMLRQIERTLVDKGADFIALPLSAETGVAMDLSLAHIDKSKSLNALLLFDKPTESGINLTFAYASALGGGALKKLLVAALAKTAELLPDDAVVGIPVVSGAASRLVKKIAGDAIISETFACSATLTINQ
jgi:ribosomal protein S18 acetylase RimI-like enzyme